MSKSTIRDRMLEWRRGISEEEWTSRSQNICQRLLDNVSFSRLTVMTYAAINREVDLSHMIDQVPDTTCFCLPVVDVERKTLTAHKLTKPRDLRRSTEMARPVGTMETGPYGILEPSPDENPVVDSIDLDLVLVPGLAFDVNGGRLGYGEGYYDRFLSQLDETTTKIGVCFDEQLVKDPLPVSEHDVPVERVVTETRMK
ncbi:MAG: 5-formyltetrahydrofolate cyclo-ligase [bacterium]